MLINSVAISVLRLPVSEFWIRRVTFSEVIRPCLLTDDLACLNNKDQVVRSGDLAVHKNKITLFAQRALF